MIFDVNLIWKKTVMCELIYLISVRQKGCNSLWSRHYFRLINLSKYNIKSSIEQHIEFVSIDSMTIANNLFSFYFEATVSKHVNRCSFNIRFKKKIIQSNLLKIVIWFGIQRIVPMVSQFNSDSISKHVWVLMIVIIQYNNIHFRLSSYAFEAFVLYERL